MHADKLHDKLFYLRTSIDIPRRWIGTPIEEFIMAQNFGYPLPSHHEPQLLLSTCIEFRYSPAIPSNYAYVVRSPGGRLVGSEFAVAFALARGVRSLILVGHDDCGMTKVDHYSGPIMKALVEQGWTAAQSNEYVQREAQRFAFADELSALEVEYYRLKKMFHAIHVAPLFVTLSEQKVHIPMWYHDMLVKESG